LMWKKWEKKKKKVGQMMKSAWSRSIVQVMSVLRVLLLFKYFILKLNIIIPNTLDFTHFYNFLIKTYYFRCLKSAPIIFW
jgi:hypothetical protein